jgi:hypothetical protein
VAINLCNLARLLHSTNRLAEAKPLMRRALAIDQASYGSVHLNVAIRLNILAMLLKYTSRAAEAEPLSGQAERFILSSLGLNHPKPEGEGKLPQNRSRAEPIRC